MYPAFFDFSTKLFHMQRFIVSRDDKRDGILYFAKRDSMKPTYIPRLRDSVPAVSTF